jgi:16S rRNA (cytosine1402-N4)-methyltransferase
MNVTQYGHTPVLLNEVLRGLNIRTNGCYIDCTFGCGGHSKAILECLNGDGCLFAMDKDPEAILSVCEELSSDPRFQLFHGPFTMLKKVVVNNGMQYRVNGILFDLGVSSAQLDNPGRGFRFRNDGHLDMRMDNSSGLTAADWIKNADEQEIAKTLLKYGEERFARQIAKSIVERREITDINTTTQLAELVAAAIPFREKDKHPATRTFQAIRILINKELEEIENALNQTVDILAEGGRLVVISFHSLEDRIVKRFMRNQARGDNYPAEIPVTKSYIRPKLKIIGKVICPEHTEVEQNPRSRSAVLRVAERLAL